MCTSPTRRSNLNGGSLSANGNGYVSALDANGNPDGIDIVGSTINAEGGYRFGLTGTGGYVFDSGVGPGGAGGLETGNGVFIENDVNPTLIETSGIGSITITGTYSQNVTTYGNQIGWTPGTNGVAIVSNAGNPATTTLSADQGTITINGTVSQGTSGDGTSPQLASGFEGVYISGGTLIEATGSGGGVSITGNTSGTTVFDNATYGPGGNDGIDIGGNSSSPATVSVGPERNLTLNGTGGTIDASNGAGSSQPYTNGVSINTGSDQASSSVGVKSRVETR